jgi:hypothetical protein
MSGSELDYSRYFWQGDSVRLRPLSIDDAEHVFAASLDSPSRQLLQLGIELPTSVEELRTSLLKWVGCKEADGAVVFTVENLEGEIVRGDLPAQP